MGKISAGGLVCESWTKSCLEPGEPFPDGNISVAVRRAKRKTGQKTDTWPVLAGSCV